MPTPTCADIQTTISARFNPLIGKMNCGQPGLVPGMLVGVTCNKMHRYYSFGDVQMVGGGASPAIEDIVMFIGSNTKVVTATMLALACLGQSEVTLRTKVPVFGDTFPYILLPTNVNYYNCNDDIPLRLWHLATHSAGYPDGPCPTSAAFGHYTFDDHTDFLANFTPPYIPGLYWHYSDQGFALLGVLMAHAFSTTTGISSPAGWLPSYRQWPTVAQNQVLVSLKMGSTIVGYNQQDKTSLAQSYGYVANGQYPAITTPFIDYNSAALGAGALTSTLADMLTFLDNQIAPPATILGEAISLTQETQGHQNLSMGMAWQKGDGYFEKNGLAVGYATYMAFDKKSKFGIFAMVNSRNSDDGGAFCNAARAALGDLRGTATKPIMFNQSGQKICCPTTSAGAA
jgi:CubicO group peptidase (beta-lactamase class C family)